MEDSDVVINVQEVSTTTPADEIEDNGQDNMKDFATTVVKSVPVLRVEQIDELNISFSCTSGEDDQSQHDGSDDAYRKEVEEFIPPNDEIKDKIIKQVEFYFSDANIMKDAFLLKHVHRNKQGYVSIKLITSFKKMKSLTKDYRVVAYSLRYSDQLEVNEEGKKVRRKTPLPDYNETSPSRSVIAINLPMANPSVENVAELFSKCGEVALIRILKPNKPVPQDIKKHANNHPEIGSTVCAVVEFEKHEQAQIAANTMNNKEDWRNGLRVVLLVESKKKQTKEKHNEKKNAVKGNEINEGCDDKDEDKKKKKRGGKRNQNTHFNAVYNDDSSCYTSGSENDHPAHQSPRLSPIQLDNHKLSPNTSPGTSPRSSPKIIPKRNLRKVGPHGKSPLAEGANVSPKTSPESGRKRYDCSGGDSAPSSPWVQRRLKAAQEMSKSPLSVSPVGSPLVGRRSADGPRKLADLDGVVRQPKGPDGTKGFHFGRGKPRASTFS